MKKLLFALISILAIPSIAVASPTSTDKAYLADFKRLAPQISDYDNLIVEDIENNPAIYVIMAYRICRLRTEGMTTLQLRRIQAKELSNQKSEKEKDTLASSFAILNVLSARYYCPEYLQEK